MWETFLTATAVQVGAGCAWLLGTRSRACLIPPESLEAFKKYDEAHEIANNVSIILH
jgi:hypothetical protein